MFIKLPEIKVPTSDDSIIAKKNQVTDNDKTDDKNFILHILRNELPNLEN